MDTGGRRTGRRKFEPTIIENIEDNDVGIEKTDESEITISERNERKRLLLQKLQEQPEIHLPDIPEKEESEEEEEEEEGSEYTSESEYEETVQYKPIYIPKVVLI